MVFFRFYLVEIDWVQDIRHTHYNIGFKCINADITQFVLHIYAKNQRLC